MNASQLYDIQIQNQSDTSISLLKSQTAAFISWVAFGLINTIAAALTIATIVVWKPLKTDTQFFAANLAVCEIGISFCAAGHAIYHLCNIYFEAPEVMVQSTCFYQTVGQYIFMLLIPTFHAVLCVDRFIAAIFPHLYLRRNRYYAQTVCVFVWIVSPCITSALYANVSDKILVVQCLGRFAIESSSGVKYSFLLLSVSLFSFLLYFLLLLILQFQIKSATKNGKCFFEISKRMRNKVSLSVAATALVHFLIYTGTLMLTMIVSRIGKQTDFSPFFVSTHIIGGVPTLAIYLLCQKNFRDGFCYVLQKISVVSNHFAKVQIGESNSHAFKNGSQHQLDITEGQVDI